MFHSLYLASIARTHILAICTIRTVVILHLGNNHVHVGQKFAICRLPMPIIYAYAYY